MGLYPSLKKQTVCEMQQFLYYVSTLSQKYETLLGKVWFGCYLLFGGIWWLNKSSVSWGLSIVVGALAALNYIDQMIQRHKNKNQK